MIYSFTTYTNKLHLHFFFPLNHKIEEENEISICKTNLVSISVSAVLSAGPCLTNHHTSQQQQQQPAALHCV